MENYMILLYEVLGSSRGSTGEATGMDKPQVVKEMIRLALEKKAEVTVDMANMRSLSPSFAYEAFGTLYDIFGDNVAHRLKFINDDKNLQARVYSAICRRKEVLSVQ